MFFSYFCQYDGVIKTRKSGFNDPTKVRDPPCDANGVEAVPLMFHASPMARARWAEDEARKESLMSDETEKFHAHTKKKTHTKNARKENAVVDPYAVREGRDGSVDSMTAAFHASYVKSTKDTHDDALTDVAQVMRERYASLRASIAEKCAPATFDGAREYAQTFFPETPTKLQRSYDQEYLCDVSAAETFCDASAEEIEAGFEGIRGKGEKRRDAKRDAKKTEKTEKTKERSSATETSEKATSPAKTSDDASMPRVHSGKVAKRDRLLIRYIDAVTP